MAVPTATIMIEPQTARVFTRTDVKKVVVPAAAPFAIATTEIVFAKPTGAALTELAEIAPAMMAAVESTPRLVKNFRSFSSAWATRFFAAFSLEPTAAPIS